MLIAVGSEVQTVRDWNLIVAVATLILTGISSVCLGYLTFLMLQLAAKPKLRFSIVGGDRELAILRGQTTTPRIHIENIGSWYAKPKATNTRVYWNFEPVFEPIQITYGSALQKSSKDVRTGKGQRKYIRAEGIHLSAGEPGEGVEAEIRAPKVPGVYKCWISAYCDQGDCGVHTLSVKVR